MLIEIPIDNEIDSQLARIATNVRTLVTDSRILAKSSSCIHAAAVSVFALEELVKYQCLKEARKSAVAAGKPRLEVDGHIFGFGRKAHDFKLNLAKTWKLIPDDAWEVHDAPFAAPAFGSPAFDVQRVLDAQLRLESIFVDYDRTKNLWSSPPMIDADKLENSNNEILKALGKVESNT